MKANDNLSFLDKYSIFKKNMDSQDTILKDKATGGLVLMRQVIVQDNENFKQIIETLEGQKDLKHNHLLYLVQYHIKSIQEETNSFHKVITFYEYSSHSLMDQLEERMKERRPFEESQLWNILCSAVLGLAYLQKENIGHGSVSLLDMYISPDGLVKIVDPSIASSSPFNFSQGYYYSPQILKYYATNEQDEGINIFKSDVFSLAVCMIQATLLEPVDDCIDYDNFEINFDILQSRLEIIGQNYSQDFVAVLAQMLSQQPVDRPDLLVMQQKLMNILGQDGTSIIEQSVGIQNQQNLLQASSPDQEDKLASREGFPSWNELDLPSEPDEALYLPTGIQQSQSQTELQNQTVIGNQNITLQSSIRGKPVEKSIKIQQSIKTNNFPTVTVIPNSTVFTKQRTFEEVPVMSKRPSQDIKISVCPPPPTPYILQQRSRPVTNYQKSSNFYENYLKQNNSDKKKVPSYATSQITIHTQNKPLYTINQQSISSINQAPKYNQTYIPSYTPPSSSIMDNSNFKKKTTTTTTINTTNANPSPLSNNTYYTSTVNITPTPLTKVSYGLNQLAPFQSQSIQLNNIPSVNTVVHVGQPLLPNTKLAPMITSNAIGSKQNNAHLFTDPKLLSMMRADIKRFQTINRDFINTDYSKPYYRY